MTNADKDLLVSLIDKCKIFEEIKGQVNCSDQTIKNYIKARTCGGCGLPLSNHYNGKRCKWEEFEQFEQKGGDNEV